MPKTVTLLFQTLLWQLRGAFLIQYLTQNQRGGVTMYVCVCMGVCAQERKRGRQAAAGTRRCLDFFFLFFWLLKVAACFGAKSCSHRGQWEQNLIWVFPIFLYSTPAVASSFTWPHTGGPDDFITINWVSKANQGLTPICAMWTSPGPIKQRKEVRSHTGDEENPYLPWSKGEMG